jgi:hypothetical protein
MVKTPMYGEVPQTLAERRKRSDDEKRKRGEVRVTAWISPEAAHALEWLTRGKKARGAVADALNEALITCATSDGMPPYVPPERKPTAKRARIEKTTRGGR